MENLHTLCQMFDDGVTSGTIKMTVDHDCGHAYNGWEGQYYTLLSDLADNRSDEDQDGWQQHPNDRLSEDDPGLVCVPEFINTLIKVADMATDFAMNAISGAALTYAVHGRVAKPLPAVVLTKAKAAAANAQIANPTQPAGTPAK